MSIITISTAPTIAGKRDQLVQLLADSVHSGASLGFLPPLDHSEAEEFWSGIDESVRKKRAELLIAEMDGEVAGAVILALPDKPNASHRAEIQKLMVLQSRRRHGIGRRLMEIAEETAHSKGRTLLVLDTRKGDPASALYEKLGWTRFGEVPGFARSANGSLHATSFYYKDIS